MDFYQGKVLRIDLSRGASAVEPLNMEWAEKYVGGKGLLLRYMWEEIPPRLDPWSADNPIFVVTGPFAGTNVSTSSRLIVGCKSPVTGVLNDSYVGGSFAPELKFAGYDMIIVTGRAPHPTVVTIKDDVVEFRPAEPKYWGMKTSAVEQALREDFDPDAKVLSIGPAGENRIPWACVSTDQYHKAGRGGHGALFGDKNLKAIAIRGTGSVQVGDAKAFLADICRIHEEYILTDDNYWVHEEGTPILVDLINGAGALPTRNWSEGEFEDADKINSEAFQKIRIKKRACSQCAIACRNFHGVELGGEMVRGEGPEYETIALCGANCGIGDIAALMKFNELCDEWGMDTISSGAVLGLAMDLTEKGVKDFGVRFGDIEGYLAAPELMATRTGIGEELALGAKALAARYGVPELAMEVKNLELPGYDPRGTFGMTLSYSTSDRGGCHMRSYPVGDEIITGDEPADTMEGKAAYNINGQNFSSMKYLGIWCDFWAIDLDQMSQLLKHLWKRDVTEAELELAGERVWNLGRLFNLREGLTAADDSLPELLLTKPHKRGPAAGRVITTEAFAEKTQEYYRLRGWDENGVPTEEKLVELGVDVRL
ncbi:MAG: aldehyde ferredoxin oxidoreductase family protein [Actinobacteria bacterium]|nr:aldehyde ferredoxin oxidoreductase family protein [Actinomycetota bacterium]